jgi:ABC-type amino acid transport substrate-binding protein
MNDGRTIETLIPGQLTLCTYGGFAPVCYRSPDGQLTGYDVAFLARFAESIGLPLVTIERPFDGLWTRPGADEPGECDLAAAGIMRRDDRPVTPGGSWSDPYFQVQRSLLVRTADQAAFDAYATLSGKTIVVTRGSTADIDATTRYPRCTIQYVDEVAASQPDPQEYIVTTLIASHQVDAFGEGDVSNQYLRDLYDGRVTGGLALADCHPLAGAAETFNVIARDASTGLLDRLNAFIAANKGSYTQPPA